MKFNELEKILLDIDSHGRTNGYLSIITWIEMNEEEEENDIICGKLRLSL